MGAQGAAGQAEDGPRPGPVLVEHVEQFRGVALLPAARVAADHGAGQPVGQGGFIAGSGGGGALAADADDLLHRPQLLGQDLLAGGGDLIRAAAPPAASGRIQPRRSSRDSAPYKVPGSRPTPLNAAMSVMIA